MTGELADALHRDLTADRLALDDLNWRDLWAYVTAAPPGTAIHHHRNKGWVVTDHIAAEQLSELRELVWRYTAIHFENGAKLPFPERVTHPGEDANEAAETEPAEITDLIAPEVIAMLKGA